MEVELALVYRAEERDEVLEWRKMDLAMLMMVEQEGFR